METLAEVFKAHGIEFDEARFARAFESALQAAGGYPPYPDPRKHFSEDELEILASGGLHVGPPPPLDTDPFIRGALQYALIRTLALTTKEAAERLGVNDSRIRQRLKERSLYGIKVYDEWRLPLFQFIHDGLVPGIEQVIPRLDPGLSPVSIIGWLSHPDPDLTAPDGRELSPLQWLQNGLAPEVVAELAEDLR